MVVFSDEAQAFKTLRLLLWPVSDGREKSASTREREMGKAQTEILSMLETAQNGGKGGVR